MLELTIDLKDKGGLTLLEKLALGLVNQLDFVTTWTRSVQQQARKNARAKGGRSFWYELAAAIQIDRVTKDAGVLGVWHRAAAQKQFGGVIRPVNAGALTIPLREEAKGKRAAEFTLGGRELFAWTTRRGKGARLLGYADGMGRLIALYVLLKSVVQRAEPYMPDDDWILASGMRELDWHLKKALGG